MGIRLTLSKIIEEEDNWGEEEDSYSETKEVIKEQVIEEDTIILTDQSIKSYEKQIDDTAELILAKASTSIKISGQFNVKNDNREAAQVWNLARWSKVSHHDPDCYKKLVVDFSDNNDVIYDNLTFDQAFIVSFEVGYELDKGNSYFSALIRKFDDSVKYEEWDRPVSGTDLNSVIDTVHREYTVVSSYRPVLLRYLITGDNGLSYTFTSNESIKSVELYDGQKLVAGYKNVPRYNGYACIDGNTLQGLGLQYTRHQSGKATYDNKNDAIIAACLTYGWSTSSTYVKVSAESGKWKFERLNSKPENPSNSHYRIASKRIYDKTGDFLDNSVYDLNDVYDKCGLARKYLATSSAIFKVQDGSGIDLGVKIFPRLEFWYQYSNAVKDYVNNGKKCVFYFEGLGGDTAYANAYHPNGYYKAMVVVTEGKTVIYTTKKASTLPDNPTFVDADTPKQGAYLYESDLHNGQYPGMRYNTDDDVVTRERMSVYSVHGNTTGQDFNIHMGGNNPGTSNESAWSLGCQIVWCGHYIKFGKAVGFINSSQEEITASSDIMSMGGSSLVRNVKAQLVIDREYMEPSQKAMFNIP